MTNSLSDKTKQGRMPVLFIGHGSPENALEKNEFTQAWADVAQRIPKPKVILCISAHWVTEGTKVTVMENPKTIHDFYGFPPELYNTEYPARGSVETAKLIKDTIRAVPVGLDQGWGLDHGTWVVLINMYPKADIPVVQLSLDETLPIEKHFQIGRELASLRDRGVLIIGSGNVVHNLMMMNPSPGAHPYQWAVDFDNFVKERLEKTDSGALINYTRQGSALHAVPTNEHYLPLLYAVGASQAEAPRFFCEKLYYTSLSMRCVIFG